MDVAILVAVCVAGLALALSFIVRWGGLEVAGAVADPPIEGPGALVVRTLRTLCVAILSGVVGGILVFGLGGRLAMRIAAATSGNDAQGLVTDAEEVVGEINLGGTIGLVIFVGMFGGLICGVLYVLLRRFLPGDARTAGAILGVVGLVIVAPSSDAINRGNPDFDILSPTWLAVLMFAVLGPLGGATVAAIVERLDRGYPQLSWRFPAILACAPLLLVLPAPPVLLILVLSVLCAALSAGAPRWRAAWSSPTAIAVGRGALLLVIVGFGVVLVGHITDIVSS